MEAFRTSEASQHLQRSFGTEVADALENHVCSLASTYVNLSFNRIEFDVLIGELRRKTKPQSPSPRKDTCDSC